MARLRKHPEVRSVFVDGGRVPPGTFEVRRAALIINYTPKTQRKITQRELELEISQELENVPDIRYWFLDENGLRAISLVVTGADSGIVANVASELATQMKRIPIIANVISETSLDRPELRIQPRADLAARLGVSTESLSQTIRVATIGDVGAALAKFDAGDRLVPIRVQLEDAARGDLPLLEQLRVPLGRTRRKGGVPLSVVADIKLDQGPTSINRYDRERQATVAADLVGTAALGDATKKIYELPVMKSLPKGVRVSPSGDAESLNELSEGFATAITAGLMMVYAVLVLLFGTFLQPITILFSLPLSIGGAIAALLVTGKQLTTPVWIGILMLMGIVTKNAIMLVDFAVEVDARGQAARRGHHRCRHETRASHRDDHDRDGGRHDAERAGVRRRRRIPLADGARRDRRPAVLDRAVAGIRAGDVHDDGRSRRTDLALRQQVDRLHRRSAAGAGRTRRSQAAAKTSRRRVAGRRIGRLAGGPPFCYRYVVLHLGPPMPSSARRPLQGTARLVAATMLCLASHQAIAAGEAVEPARKGAAVSVLTAAKSCFDAIVEVSGIVRPREETFVRPERQGLKVAEILADAGDTVTPGQTLARLALPEGGVLQVQAPVAGLVSASTATIGAIASARGDALFTIIARSEFDLIGAGADPRPRPS